MRVDLVSSSSMATAIKKTCYSDALTPSDRSERGALRSSFSPEETGHFVRLYDTMQRYDNVTTPGDKP